MEEPSPIRKTRSWGEVLDLGIVSHCISFFRKAAFPDSKSARYSSYECAPKGWRLGWFICCKASLHLNLLSDWKSTLARLKRRRKLLGNCKQWSGPVRIEEAMIFKRVLISKAKDALRSIRTHGPSTADESICACAATVWVLRFGCN